MKKSIVFVLFVALILAGCSKDQDNKEKESDTVKVTVQENDSTEDPSAENSDPSVETEPETLPPGTIYADDENDVYNILRLSKYVDSADTALDITEVKVLSNLNPGVAKIDAFKAGDILLVNLLCNSEAKTNSVAYIVPEKTEHKNEYSYDEYIAKYDMYAAYASDNSRLFFEFPLPEQIDAGVYELRFVCDTEEGYIPFHFS